MGTQADFITALAKLGSIVAAQTAAVIEERLGHFGHAADVGAAAAARTSSAVATDGGLDADVAALVADLGGGGGATVVQDNDFLTATSVPITATLDPAKRYHFYLHLDTDTNGPIVATLELTDSHSGPGGYWGFSHLEDATTYTNDVLGLTLACAAYATPAWGYSVLREKRAGAQLFFHHERTPASSGAGSPIASLTSGIVTLAFDSAVITLSAARAGHITILEETP